MSQAVTTPPSDIALSQTWLDSSVQAYFSQINWQGTAPGAFPSAEALEPTIPKGTPAPWSLDVDTQLSLDLKVGEFVARLNWQGQRQSVLSSSQVPLPSPKPSHRPPAEAILDLELLENVFLPEGKEASDISIGDFSDFF
jgi:hypothetical protein